MEKLDAVKAVYKIITAVGLFTLVCYAALKNVRPNIALGLYGSVPLYYFTSIGGTFSVLILSSAIKGKIGKAIGFFGKNSLTFFAIHSMYLYAYAAILTSVLGRNTLIMQNIDMPLCWLGAVLIMILIIPMKWAYDQTGGRLVRIITVRIGK